MSKPEDDLNQANPHALNTIIQASEKRSIVASEDILDERGVKLLARGQPVSASLQQRLLERKLKQPLETTLSAANGVNPLELSVALQTFIASDHTIAPALRAWNLKLTEEVKSIKMHSVVQLLLTAAQAARPGAYDHAVRAMGLAGAMWLSGGGDHAQLRTVLLGGLLHDIGEMYVNPSYLDTNQPLDTAGYRNVAVHPHTGAMVLGRMADYPQPLVQAIAEHHERLDGTGYPRRAKGSDISQLGRLLAVIEVTMGITTVSKAPWTHASFALRMIPGEFDGMGVSFVTAAARQAGEDLTPTGKSTLGKLSLLSDRLVAALAMSAETQRNASTPAVKTTSERANYLLHRLRSGWNEMGLWADDQVEGDSAGTNFELWMASRELDYRMRFIRRDCLWIEKDLSDAENQELTSLWSSLEGPPSDPQLPKG